MKIALHFTTVRFMPIAETFEFANVGVIAYAPQTGFVDFKLAPSRFKRVSDFFDDLDGKLYSQALKTFESELKYVKSVSQELTGKQLHHYINEITRTREGIMTFGEGGVMFTTNPNETLDKLFNRYIGRSFADTKEYREKQMVRALRQDLTSQVSVRYKEQSLDTGFSSFKLPLVANEANKVKAIKPLAFDQQSPLQLADHGDRWISRIKHLIKGNAINEEDFLFTIEKPISKKREFLTAFNIVESGMKDLGVKVIPFDDKERIFEFAQFNVDNMVDRFELA